MNERSRLRAIMRQVTPPILWNSFQALASLAISPKGNQPGGPEWHTIRAGHLQSRQMLLDTRAEFARQIIQGEYEKLLTEWIVATVRPPMTCYDIGGHVGYFTLLMATLAHDGHVHVCEPFEGNAATIEAVVKRNQLTNVTLHRCAVSDTNGFATLCGPQNAAPTSESSMSYLRDGGGVISSSASRFYPEFTTHTVEIRRLDTLSIETPDVVKIDVEGAEAIALNGADEWFSKGHLPVFAIETHGVRQALACSAFFHRHDYLYEIVNTTDARPIVVWRKRSIP